jgi:hypothetical protein
MLAIYENGLVSKIGAGENGGRDKPGLGEPR